jgi:hypothetical protein
MNDSTQTPVNTPAGSSDGASLKEKPSPELVRKVTEKVYSMLLEDLRIEQERRPIKVPRRRVVSRRLH